MIAVREIMCATDVERPSYAGLRYAFFLADQLQCSLQVVHACPETESVRPNTYQSGAQRLEHVHATHRLRARLEVLVREVPTGSSGRATTHVVDGKLAEALLAHAERQRPALIVLGAAAKDSASPGESLAQRLTRQASCPILTVPAREPGPSPRVKRILVVLPPTPSVGLTVEWTAFWARHFGAVVELLYREGSQLNSVGNEAMCRHEVEEKLRRAGVGVDSTFVEADATLTARVVDCAENGRCDLVIVNAALRDESDRHVVASIRGAAPLPVLSVRDFTPDRSFVDSTAERGFGT
jgi:nucleotide-binding universal stress UspA family protein